MIKSFYNQDYEVIFNKNIVELILCCDENIKFQLSQKQYECLELQTKQSKNNDINDYHNEFVSYYNDMIQFNPFQYKPYLKLISDQNKYKSIYVADEVGVGKTFETGIIISELLHSKKININDNIVIICPNMLCRKWQEVLHTFFGLSSKIVKNPKDISGISIISFNSISRTKEYDATIISLLIIDEAHNASGERFNSILKYREKTKNDGYVVLLSATPLSGKSSDMENQKELILCGRSGEIAFTEENMYFNRTLKDEMREEEVICNIENINVGDDYVKSYVNICNDIFSGRNTIRKFAGLNMLLSSPAAANAYCENLLKLSDDEIKKLLAGSTIDKDIMDEYGYESIYDVYELFESDIDKFDDILVDNDITDEKVLQIKNNILAFKNYIDDMNKNDNNDGKLDKLKEIIEKNNKIYLSEEPEKEYYKKIVVFTNFNETADYLHRNIPNSIVINGTIDEQKKWKNFNQFKDSDDIKVLIITNVACEGQDMDFCNTIVNYDLTYNPVQLAQRKGRIDRFKVKKKKIFIKNFIFKGIDPTKDQIEKFILNYPNEKEEQISYISKFSKEYPNSIYAVILRKLYRINDETGIYYNVIDEIGKNKIEGNRDNVKDELVKLFQEKHSNIKNYSDIENNYNQIKKKRYERANKLLIEKSVRVSEANDEELIITVKKTNKDFLRYLYDGGTLNSHIIYNERGDY